MRHEFVDVDLDAETGLQLSDSDVESFTQLSEFLLVRRGERRVISHASRPPISAVQIEI
jgi:hypothetical protein